MNTKLLRKSAVSIALALTMFSTMALAASINFNDVPTNHWAHPSISKMADQGIMAGVGDGMYAPEGTVSNAAFITMVSRQFYKTKDGSDVWYGPHLEAAKKAGILNGTMIGMDDNLANSTINRYDMAQIMYNVMGSPTATGDTSKITDWSSVPSNYRNAVSVCYSMGLLTGVDQKGTFNGNGVMTRAQAATIMDRLITAKGGSTTTPEQPPVEEQPEAPQGSVAVTTAHMRTDLREGQSFNNGVFTLKYNPMGTINPGPRILELSNPGYSKITFTVKSNETDSVTSLLVSGVDNASGSDIRYTTFKQGGHLNAGETRTVTVDISGIKAVNVNFRNEHNGVNVEVSNIYFHN